MRFPFYFVLLSQFSLFTAGSLCAQEFVTPPIALQPTVFQKYRGQRQELKMPATITDVNLAGNGRYLLVYMKSLRKLNVYDVNAARITKELDLATDDAMIAAGAAHFIVVNRAQNLIERWSLSSFQREAVKPLPIRGEVSLLELDYSSYGPLKLTWKEIRSYIPREQYRKPVLYFDLKTLEQTEPPKTQAARPLTKDEQSFIRKLGVCTHPDYAITIPDLMRYGKRYPTGDGVEHVGIFTRKPVKLIGYAEIAFLEHLKLRRDDPVFHIHKRVYFIPQADQVIAIPVTNQSLHISRLELSKLLEKEPDYLSVSSLPPGVGLRGQEWKYQLEVESTAQDVSVELSAAPEGMQISESGKLTWRVPDTFKEDQVLVIVTLTTQKGGSNLQTFSIEIRDR